MRRAVIRRNITCTAILIYISLYLALIMLRPAFIFNEDGSLRNFGVGFRKKTVIPAWLLAITLAIGSYFSVLYYISCPKFIEM